MLREKSCGAAAFTTREGEVLFLLVKSRTGVWGFPKGRSEAGETDEETALREVMEETGVSVRLLPGFRAEENYDLPGKPGTGKTVRYFLAHFDRREPVFPKDELKDAGLFPYERALALLAFEGRKAVLRAADEHIEKVLHITENLNPGIACCGVDCFSCTDYREGKCPSCRKTDWRDDPCMPVACCRERGIDCCALCSSFPCPDMAEFYGESQGHALALAHMRALRKSLIPE